MGTALFEAPPRLGSASPTSACRVSKGSNRYLRDAERRPCLFPSRAWERVRTTRRKKRRQHLGFAPRYCRLWGDCGSRRSLSYCASSRFPARSGGPTVGGRRQRRLDAGFAERSSLPWRLPRQSRRERRRMQHNSCRNLAWKSHGGRRRIGPRDSEAQDDPFAVILRERAVDKINYRLCRAFFWLDF